MKALHARATRKVLLVSFFDQKGVVHMEFFHWTITAQVSILTRRGLKFLKNFVLHVDNASPHMALIKNFLLQSDTFGAPSLQSGFSSVRLLVFSSFEGTSEGQAL